MDLTIIGAGNMGRGLGTRLVAGGNKVTILDRDPEEARGLARSCKGAPRWAAAPSTVPPATR
jgi:8-hydroxy-5-deazaflavin:NADPH oxidoreductase